MIYEEDFWGEFLDEPNWVEFVKKPILQMQKVRLREYLTCLRSPTQKAAASEF